MNNEQYADLLEEAAQLMQILDDNAFRIRAYERASRTVRGLSAQVEDLMDRGELKGIPGIGKGITDELLELRIRRSSKNLDALRNSLPENIGDLLKVHGLGPKRVRLVFDSLGVSDLRSLEEAARSGQLATLPGLGAKSVANILKEIERLKNSAGRRPFHIALRAAEEILAALQALDAVERIEIAGSLRRGRPTVKDLDLVVASNAPKTVMDAFVQLPSVTEIINHGETKSSVYLSEQISCDLRVVPPEVFGATLHHFTGSKDHNVAMRARAVQQGLRISEYGVFRRDGDDEAPIACATEEDVFRAVGLPWIPPEIRENTGEIERAAAGTLPDLIDLRHIRSDLHMHTTWSDGHQSIQEMAEAAIARGYEYLCITDHSRALAVANGLDRDRLLRQLDEIAAVNERLPHFRVLAGLEADILEDGAIDMDDDVLERLDWCVGSVHQWTRQTKEVMTARVVRAIRSGGISALGHPTGRLIGDRDPYELDLEEVFIACAESNVALEINASRRRLDLDSSHVRRAMEDPRIRFTINTDAHHVRGLDNMVYGVMTARRGWATPDRIVNAYSLNDFLKNVRKPSIIQ